MGDIIKRGTKDRPRFYMRYKDADGIRKLKATKVSTLTEARTVLAAVETRIAKGQVGIVEPTKEEAAKRSITFKQLADKFADEYSSPKLKDPKRYRREARSILNVRVLPHIGTMAACTVKANDIDRMRDQITLSGSAPRSAEMAMATTSKVFNWARRQELIDCLNPVSGCLRPHTESSIDFLSRQEVGGLLSYLERGARLGIASWQTLTLFPMVATAIYTGARKGELFGLRWCDVNLEAGRIDIVRSYRLAPKSGKARHLPMHPELVRILTQWKAICPKMDENLVFPVRGFMGDRFENFGLDNALAAADCHRADKPWHALRHSFASHFMMSGGNILTLQKLLGHSDIKMTLIYSHLAPDFMAGEVARMSFHIPVAGISDLGEARRVKAVEDGYSGDTRGNSELEILANS